jgi:hypothetical protein
MNVNLAHALNPFKICSTKTFTKGLKEGED